MPAPTQAAGNVPARPLQQQPGHQARPPAQQTRPPHPEIVQVIRKDDMMGQRGASTPPDLPTVTQKSAEDRCRACLSVHCTQNPIYVFQEKELRGLSSNSDIHVSVSDLYIPRIGPHIWLQKNRYISHRYISVGIGRQNITILFWK
jgi:hypothetical protein